MLVLQNAKHTLRLRIHWDKSPISLQLRSDKIVRKLTWDPTLGLAWGPPSPLAVFVPFRGSILTRVLEDSLTNRSRCYIIANLSPSHLVCIQAWVRAWPWCWKLLMHAPKLSEISCPESLFFVHTFIFRHISLFFYGTGVQRDIEYISWYCENQTVCSAVG